MNKIGIITLIVLSLISLAHADEGPKVCWTTEFKSAFLIAPAVKLADEVWQNDLTVKWTGGYFISAWVSTGYAEKDVTAGMPLKSLGLPGAVEGGIYMLPPTSKVSNDFFTASWSTSHGPFAFSVQHLGGVGNDSPAGGWFLKADAAKAVSLSPEVKLKFHTRLTWDSGVARRDSAFIARFKPELTIALPKDVSFFVGWEGHLPLTDRDARDFQQASRAGLRFTF